MGNSTDNYENDPYIDKANSAYNPLKYMYTQNSVIPLTEQNKKAHLSIDLLSSQQQKKVTTAYQNPIKIDINSITLMKDGYNPQIYYISFRYTSERSIGAAFHLNSEFVPQPVNNGQYFIPSPSFRDVAMRKMINPGIDQTFNDPTVYVESTYFFANKSYCSVLTDLIIELSVFDMNQNVECTMAIFCKIIKNQNNVSIKPVMEKCKVYNSVWYDIKAIFGITSQDKLCEICCTNQKNTYFVPCNHSYTCKDCAIILRVKGEACPLCRQPISDSVIIETKGNYNS